MQPTSKTISTAQRRICNTRFLNIKRVTKGSAVARLNKIPIQIAPCDCISLAKENKIAHQCEILTYGGTDTSAIQMTGAGAMVGALSIPTRYIHSGTEMLDLADAKACVDLAVKFVEKI